MTKLLALALAVPLALVAGCGTDAKSCTITTSGSTKTLTCPDGTTADITGTPGAAGTAGEPSLANVVDEPAGTNCPNGGKAIETGVDTNGNGVLDPSEVKGTSYVCNEPAKVVTGDVFVQNSLDLAAIAGVQTITGTLLLVESPGFTSVSLPALVHVGTLQVEADGGLTSLAFPALTTVDTDLYIEDDGDGITALDFSALTTTGGLSVEGLAITGVSTFSKITQVGEDGLGLGNLAQLVSLDGLEGALASATHIELDDLPLATDVSALGAITTAVTLDIDALGATAFNFTALTSATTFDVEGNGSLLSISLPALSTGQLTLERNTALTTISAPLLPAGDVSIDDSETALSTCTFSGSTTCPTAP